MVKVHIRKGDEVIVLSGNERNQPPAKILSIDREKMRAVVEGLALRKIHIRRTQENPKGGVIEKEGTIHISNLMVVCPKCKKPTRVGRRAEAGQSVRVCKKCGESMSS